MKLHYRLGVVLLIITLIFVAGCTNNEKAMVNAVKSGDTTTVQSLLDKGVSPNLKTDDGKTILMLATYLGHTEIAKLLINKGAEVNAKDNKGKTALMYAAEKGNIETAKLLLEKGANLDAVDNDGKTALLIARENNQIEMVKFLSNWGKPIPTPVVTITLTPTPTLMPTEAPTSTPEATPTTATVENANKQLSPVFFDFDQSVLRSDQNETMKDNLETLKENSKLYLILGGHADERGTRVYNLELSKRRAQTIQKYLIDNGIAPERIIIYAFGKDYPLKKEHDEASRSYNRRVDILEWDTVITKKQVIDETIK